MSPGWRFCPWGSAIPGGPRGKGGGDAPPRPECGPLWQPPFLDALPQVETILLVGGYAQAFHLGQARAATMTETVRRFADFGPRHFPLPHPSWRNTAWMRRNPWFVDEILPLLKERVRDLLVRPLS